jgi:hypothetical protein
MATSYSFKLIFVGLFLSVGVTTALNSRNLQAFITDEAPKEEDVFFEDGRRCAGYI